MTLACWEKGNRAYDKISGHKALVSLIGGAPSNQNNPLDAEVRPIA